MPSIPHLRASVAFLAAASAAAPAQSPTLSLQQQAYSQQSLSGSLDWQVFGRVNDIYVLLADLSPGNTNVLGKQFDLGFSAALLPVAVGVIGPTGSAFGFTSITPAGLPAGAPIYCQAGEWDVAQGFGSLLTSNVASFGAHLGSTATTISFSVSGQWPFMTGVYDASVPYRLQALPPSTRTVRPLPPQALPMPQYGGVGPLNASGARFQLALRAADFGGSGVPENVIGVHWRPLFGTVVNENFPQLELTLAHSDVVPNYTIDSFTSLPALPTSGLSTQFGANAVPGSTAVVYSGPYAVQAQAMLPNGYMPFPLLQQPFAWDGERTMLFEMQCSPAPGLGPVQNHMISNVMVFSSQQPHATVFASAGFQGQPAVLNPSNVTAGDGTASLYDLEVELQRTVSVATSTWIQAPTANTDYLTPIISAYAPSGTSIEFSYRGRSTAGTETAWSNTPDIADNLPELQFRVTMHANAATGAVPWVQQVILPML